MDMSDSWQPAFRLKYGNEEEQTSVEHANGEQEILCKEGSTVSLVLPYWRRFELAELDKALTIKLLDI